MSDFERVSIREFARRVGTSEGYIRKCTKPDRRGVIKIMPDSFIEEDGKRVLLYEKALKEYQVFHSVEPIIGQNVKHHDLPPNASPHAIATRLSLSRKSQAEGKPVKNQPPKMKTVKNQPATAEAGKPTGDHLTGKPPVSLPEPPKTAANDPSEMQLNALAINESDRRERSAKAQLAEIKLKEALGELVSFPDVRKALVQYGIEVRNAITSIPYRCVDNIRAAETRQEALSVLNLEINKALLGLTDAETRKLTKRD